ncbi:sodium/bile acid cotransporter 7-B-like [Chrysoperla carnea]|uniref:sodium/bile acid cotransporter 7-B-like n=1 Tax=Chrysoperla carnea TaxID=189513 RepID=UPI001D09173B|nr:sodium/bile acid cotransporter 7-B-like [Chrysoperla carnea]
MKFAEISKMKSQTSKKGHRNVRLQDLLRKHWFILGILLSIIFAAIAPNIGTKGGVLKPEYTVKYGAVSVIFLISGLSLKTEDIFQTLTQYKLHLFIQIFTFIVIPVFTHFWSSILLFLGVNSWIIKGMLTVACMPPPVSSAVILTRASHGNETTAIFNSVLGSFLGILITPLALLITLGSTTVVPLVNTIIQLIITVLGPLVIGQLIRKFSKFRGHGIPLNNIGQILLLFIIYTTFCDTFMTHEMGLSAIDILVTIVLVLVLQILMMAMSYSIASNFPKLFSPSEVVAIIFCSTHKSLTLGIPILRIMFHGYSHLSQISLPLLVYHPAQIILGGLMTTQLKDWVRDCRNKRLPV